MPDLCIASAVEEAEGKQRHKAIPMPSPAPQKSGSATPRPRSTLQTAIGHIIPMGKLRLGAGAGSQALPEPHVSGAPLPQHHRLTGQLGWQGLREVISGPAPAPGRSIPDGASLWSLPRSPRLGELPARSLRQPCSDRTRLVRTGSCCAGSWEEKPSSCQERLVLSIVK